jgi:dihydroorotase
VHLRDDDMLRAVLPHTAAQFARAIIMPNLVPPVTTVAAAEGYRDRITAALPPGSTFPPLMTCYLTEATSVAEIEYGFKEGVWVAAKLYPAGATTNSHHGVRNVAKLKRVLETMQRIDMPLLIHGEATDPEVDIFDREAVFVERILTGLLHDYPALKVVLEHVTTAEEAAEFVRAHAPRLAATITPHHLLINRTSIFQGGIRPHLYCLPIAKRERHRLALRRAATSGEACFFLGTDTAPHSDAAKQAACGCAGIFVAPSALQTYAQVFDEEGRLENLEVFASLNGPRFYGLPLNEGTVTLRRHSARLRCGPALALPAGDVTVFRADEELPWSLDAAH